jgi:hypothetical protein
MPEKHRKIKKIMPGDFISDYDPNKKKCIGAFILGINCQQKHGDVVFLILGESSICEGTIEKESYFLLSRIGS